MLTDIFEFSLIFMHYKIRIKKRGEKGLIYYSVDAIIIIDKFRQIQDDTIIKIQKN